MQFDLGSSPRHSHHHRSCDQSYIQPAAWFIQSQDRKSKFRDWYIRADNDPGWKGPWDQEVWHSFGSDYFYAYFWEGMADLNNTNPQVTSEMEKVTRFWLEQVGTDGFRLDATGALIEEGPVCTRLHQN